MKEPLNVGTIDQILTAPDIGTELMEVPEWGCAIRLRGISKRQQSDIREESTRGGQVVGELVVLLTFIEGVVEPQFTRAHIAQLQERAASVIDRVVARIFELSGLTEDDNRRMMERFPTR